MLREFETRRTLTLRERQQVAGRMQRAVMTMPPGAACFMATMYSLMRGLSLPWQSRQDVNTLCIVHGRLPQAFAKRK